MWLSIASKLVPGIIKTGMSIASNRRRAKEFESVAEMRHAEKMANGEVEYQKAVMQNLVNAMQAPYSGKFITLYDGYADKPAADPTTDIEGVTGSTVLHVENAD